MSEQLRERESEAEEVLSWAEFACWTALVLMPFLQWVNGPSVSTDQAVVRTALVILALGGGIVLRVVNWRRKARCDRSRVGPERVQDQSTTAKPNQ